MDFYLVRHGNNDFLGKGLLAGRLANVHLNELGRSEAARLAETLASSGIQRIFSSPLERAVQTAEPTAKQLGLEIEVTPQIMEIDFGDWTGKAIRDLDRDPAWRNFNLYRSGTRVPNGENMLEAQTRMVSFVEKTFRENSNQTVAIFSHGDPIKALIAYYLGIPLDLFTRIEISPGSYSILRLETWGPQVVAVNRLPS
ncbi:MAG TPA: histidine phosphatase family protein [Verrucomicrobiae bacterium]